MISYDFESFLIGYLIGCFLTLLIGILNTKIFLNHLVTIKMNFKPDEIEIEKETQNK